MTKSYNNDVNKSIYLRTKICLNPQADERLEAKGKDLMAWDSLRPPTAAISSTLLKTQTELSNSKQNIQSCLGCSSRPSTKYFFLAVTYFNSFVPIAQQAGEAVVLVACLLVCVSGSDACFRRVAQGRKCCQSLDKWKHLRRNMEG
jgi:hypothetical protein